MRAITMPQSLRRHRIAAVAVVTLTVAGLFAVETRSGANHVPCPVEDVQELAAALTAVAADRAVVDDAHDDAMLTARAALTLQTASNNTSLTAQIALVQPTLPSVATQLTALLNTRKTRDTEMRTALITIRDTRIADTAAVNAAQAALVALLNAYPACELPAAPCPAQDVQELAAALTVAAADRAVVDGAHDDAMLIARAAHTLQTASNNTSLTAQIALAQPTLPAVAAQLTTLLNTRKTRDTEMRNALITIRDTRIASTVAINVTQSALVALLNAYPACEPPVAPPSLWHADADADFDRAADETRFYKREVTSGIWSRLSIVPDPLGLHGDVYRANLTAADINAGNDRAEWRGSYVDGSSVTFGRVGDNLWYGWRSMFGGDVALTNAENDGNWMQLKGNSSCGGPAVGMTIRYNRLSLRTIDGDYLAWIGPLMTDLLDDQWHDFVLHVVYGKPPAPGSGSLELWLDGVPQVMTNGQTHINIPTMCPNDVEVRWKLGTYSMNDGIGAGPIHWTESPRIGLTKASVEPR